MLYPDSIMAIIFSRNLSAVTANNIKNFIHNRFYKIHKDEIRKNEIRKGKYL